MVDMKEKDMSVKLNRRREICLRAIGPGKGLLYVKDEKTREELLHLGAFRRKEWVLASAGG